jgi:transposase
MRQVHEVLRLKFEGGLSDRQIGRSLGIPRTTVRDYVLRFETSGLAWPVASAGDEAALERLLFTRGEPLPPGSRPLPDWALIHRELQRKGVTLQLLWQEYRSRDGTGYGHSQFAVHYKAWLGTVDPVMRQVYKAGERAFVDYAGMTMEVIDTATGEVRTAQIFVAVLGASNYTYAEATWTQQITDWIASHVRAVEYFGGGPELWVPDNLRSAVASPSFYEPALNPSYAEFAAHYAAAILPARVKRPRDKGENSYCTSMAG